MAPVCKHLMEWRLVAPSLYSTRSAQDGNNLSCCYAENNEKSEGNLECLTHSPRRSSASRTDLWRRQGKGVKNSFLLKAHNFGKANASKQLNIENLFHGRLKFNHRDPGSTSKVNYGYSTFELVAKLSHGYSRHG